MNVVPLLIMIRSYKWHGKIWNWYASWVLKPYFGTKKRPKCICFKTAGKCFEISENDIWIGYRYQLGYIGTIDIKKFGMYPES